MSSRESSAFAEDNHRSLMYSCMTTTESNNGNFLYTVKSQWHPGERDTCFQMLTSKCKRICEGHCSGSFGLLLCCVPCFNQQARLPENCEFSKRPRVGSCIDVWALGPSLPLRLFLSLLPLSVLLCLSKSGSLNPATPKTTLSRQHAQISNPTETWQTTTVTPNPHFLQLWTTLTF